MSLKKAGPPALPAGYHRLHSRVSTGAGGALVQEYGVAPPETALLTARLCAWLENRKEIEDDTNNRLGGNHPGRG